MDFGLNEQQEMIKKSAYEFAEAEIAPKSEEWAETGEWPYEVWEKLSKLGYTGVIVDPEYGGSGMSYFESILIMEEFARADDAFTTSYQVHNIICDMFKRFGTDQQKKEWLPKLASGEVMGAFALTEPNAGSDASGIVTKAELKDGQWLINGAKIFITNAGLKNSMGVVLMCVTGQKDGRKEISSVIVPRGTPGFIVGSKFKKIGWAIMDTREIMFEDCKVPESNILGGRGKGLSNALKGLNLGRLDFGAIGTGMARAALEYSLEYAKQRVQFGRSISSFQAIQFYLAEMACNVETARLHTWRAADLMDRGLPHDKEATMAKMTSSLMAKDNILKGFQIHGGYGFMVEYPISRLYRNMKIMEIGEGTTEVCKIVISRALGV